jgi:hypothetical protein
MALRVGGLATLLTVAVALFVAANEKAADLPTFGGPDFSYMGDDYGSQAPLFGLDIEGLDVSPGNVLASALW